MKFIPYNLLESVEKIIKSYALKLEYMFPDKVVKKREHKYLSHTVETKKNAGEITIQYENGLRGEFKFYNQSGRYLFDFKIMLNSVITTNRVRTSYNNQDFHLFRIQNMLDGYHEIQKKNPLGTLGISFPITMEEIEVLKTIKARAKRLGLDWKLSLGKSKRENFND